MKIALAFLLAVIGAESITIFVDVIAGIVFYGVILAAIIFIPAVFGRWRHSRFLLSLVLVPLVRIVSLSIPLAGLPQISWFPIIYGPLFVAGATLMPVLGLGYRQVGFNFNSPAANSLVALSGIPLGFAEYAILAPEPLIGEFTWQMVLLASFVLIVTTGLVEEFIFRGIIQTTAVKSIGISGILYVAIVFAVLHMGFFSVLDVFFVLAVGFYFGWIVYKTGSIWGVILAHGFTNIVLFVLAPFVIS